MFERWVASFFLCFTLTLAATTSFASTKLLNPAKTYDSGGPYPNWTAVADVNGDGKADLIVVNDCGGTPNCYSGALAVLLGNGDGTFQAAQTYNSGGEHPASVAAADLNGDGKVDLIVADGCPTGSNSGGCLPSSIGQVAVLLGNGDGTFQPAQLYNNGGSGPNALAVADVNGDGRPDVIVARATDACPGAIDVLLANGDGTLQAVRTYSSGGCGPNSVAIADVNGDGKADLLVADRCSIDSCIGVAAVLLGKGDGTFETPQSYSSGDYQAKAIAVSDVNEDGKPDLIVANYCTISCANGADVGVLLGNGDGTFQPVQLYSSGGFAAIGMVVGDVNEDGHSDIIVLNCGLNSQTCVHKNATIGKGEVAVLLGNGDGTFAPPLSYASGGETGTAVAVADLNGDGKLDVVATNQCKTLSSCSDGVIGVLLNATLWNTTTVLVSSPNPSVLNQFVTLTATVSGHATPEGRVTFETSGTILGSAKLNNGVAMIRTRKLPQGATSISAYYLGNTGFGPSTSPAVIQVVNPAGPTP